MSTGASERPRAIRAVPSSLDDLLSGLPDTGGDQRVGSDKVVWGRTGYRRVALGRVWSVKVTSHRALGACLRSNEMRAEFSFVVSRMIC